MTDNEKQDQDNEQNHNKIEAGIATTEETRLAPNNPKIIALAEKFHWRPETAIARMKRYLPTVFEQQLYLIIGPSFGILPESMAKLFKIFMSSRSLNRQDMEYVSLGKNLVASLFNEFSDFIQECLNILKIITANQPDFSVTINEAAIVVLTCGNEDPVRLIEMIDIQLDEFCELFRISKKRPYPEKLRLCVWIMVEKVIPFNQKRGITDPLDLSDFLELDEQEQHELIRAIGGEPADYLSMDDRELGNSKLGADLKKWGVI